MAAPSAPHAAALGAATLAGAAALVALYRYATTRRPAAPPPLDPLEDAAVEEAIVWATTHGLLVRGEPRGAPTWTHCPMALRPTPYPRAEFERAVRLAPLFGRLVDRVSRDVPWLHRTLAPTAASDPFTRRLLEISRAVHEEGEAQGAKLGLLRSDYMLHAPALDESGGAHESGRRTLLQVELNTIASSFGALGALVTKMHAAVAPPPKGAVPPSAPGVGPPACPPNGNLEGLPDALAAAHAHYCEQVAVRSRSYAASGGSPPPHRSAPRAAYAASTGPARGASPGRGGGGGARASPGGAGGSPGPAPPPSSADPPLPVVLFVVQPGERNAVDQRLLEVRSHGRLVERSGLRVLLLSGVPPRASERLDSPDSLRGPDDLPEVEVSAVYFRAGYTPDDYPSSHEWAARLLIERAFAIKCPCIDYHLAGAKKVQQALALPGAVERFLSPAEATAVRGCFAGLHALSELDETLPGSAGPARPAGRTLRETVEAEPHAWVLKPQREGGGNNTYGQAIPPMLSRLRPDELDGYILMQRIFPPIHHGRTLVRAEQAAAFSTVSELGIFSTILADEKGREMRNLAAGHLLRTKPADADEGGVAAGYAVLDSPLLH